MKALASIVGIAALAIAGSASAAPAKNNLASVLFQDHSNGQQSGHDFSDDTDRNNSRHEGNGFGHDNDNDNDHGRAHHGHGHGNGHEPGNGGGHCRGHMDDFCPASP